MKKKDDGTVFDIGLYRKEQWPLLESLMKVTVLE
jgi:hypothetical protein